MSDDFPKNQALIVTKGPFQGRICNNDDDDFLFAEELDQAELDWYEESGVTWVDISSYTGDEGGNDKKLGVVCEIVTFGHYLDCRGHHLIPREFLRPASMKDLISRSQEISNSLGQFVWTGRDLSGYREAFEILLEKTFIIDEIWGRERLVKHLSVSSNNLFLCHASDDKPFVRQVMNDLSQAGHSVWMDEFEISVGDSIVDKINSATENAQGLVLFISNASNNSAWVKKEWQSVLMRYLSEGSPKIFPAKIEECHIPPIITDIKYADFSESYNDGLDSLLLSIGQLSED